MSDQQTTEARAEAVRALEVEFGELASQFRRHMQDTANRISPGMLPGAYKVLGTIARLGPITLSALAESLVADKGLVSRTIRELEGLDLVARTPDPADGRSSLLSITASGATRLADARRPAENRLSQALDAWSLDDIRHLTALLHALSSGEVPGEALPGNTER
ncbi:MAG TPA: MarR family transcriptional regulator [Microbacterium sp.]|uniref:MarR family winged helix-turn-helix transcriptional regulator n=1 Tax=Microbacterium sp. TaxID=51671 RepID=UPI002BFA849B|nr:MarR family transcriptional regulator [Microbacterium sp.]HWI31863.1 MarR family transcriptional regulator [Microbacterium sp.]